MRPRNKDRGKIVEWVDKLGKTRTGKISMLDNPDYEKLSAEGKLPNGKVIVRTNIDWVSPLDKTHTGVREVKLLIRAEKLKLMGFYD